MSILLLLFLCLCGLLVCLFVCLFVLLAVVFQKGGVGGNHSTNNGIFCVTVLMHDHHSFIHTLTQSWVRC